MREAHNLLRVQVTAAVGTDEAQMIRIEKGEIDTRGSLLVRIAATVHADLTDVATLMLSVSANSEKG